MTLLRQTSPFQILFNKKSGQCQTVCTKKYDLGKDEDKKKITQLRKGMSMNYQHHWIVDNMPVRRFFSLLTVSVSNTIPFSGDLVLPS